MIKEHVKKEIILLREGGYSIQEIANKVNVTKSTISLLVRRVELNGQAKKILLEKRMLARAKASQVLIQKRKDRQTASRVLAEEILKACKITKENKFLIASMLYECEGGKSEFGVVEFTNSDPLLVQLFLFTLRASFVLDEKKFRVVMHLHSYHDEKDEKLFWSKITGIPADLFLKTYQKKESGVRQKDNYHGCVQIKYFDVSIKRTLLAAKNIFANKMGL